ncbi:MAG: hypothetical protein HYZ86_00415, partial [Candidatus Omnitrophica bacterium]|nr:hypothetical protein [Candidatus Omnitrophota bacterium]
MKSLFLSGFLLLGTAACAVSVYAAPAPFSAGEVITYDIKQMGFKVGRATLTFPGEVLYEGQRLFLIVFRADG